MTEFETDKEWVMGITDEGEHMTATDGARLATLWHSGPLQRAFELNRTDPTHWVLDQATYYLEHAERIGAEDFSPDERDIVKTRVLTSGINVINFVDQACCVPRGETRESGTPTHAMPDPSKRLRGRAERDDTPRAPDATGLCIRRWELTRRVPRRRAGRWVLPDAVSSSGCEPHLRRRNLASQHHAAMAGDKTRPEMPPGRAMCSPYP